MTTKCTASDLPKPAFWTETKEAVGTFTYHYVRLFRQVGRDVRRWSSKPADGHRKVAGISDH